MCEMLEKITLSISFCLSAYTLVHSQRQYTSVEKLSMTLKPFQHRPCPYSYTFRSSVAHVLHCCLFPNSYQAR